MLEEAYVHVFLKLKRLGLHVQRLTTDFELAMMNAWKRVFRLPTQELAGCLLHYVVCLDKAVGRLGLLDYVQENEYARVIFRRFTALPRLPKEKIGQAFTLLKLEAQRRGVYIELYDFFIYYWCQWLRIVRPDRLSVYKRYHTTNNNCETHHTHVWRYIHCPLPTAWDLMGKHHLSFRLDRESSINYQRHIGLPFKKSLSCGVFPFRS